MNTECQRIRFFSLFQDDKTTAALGIPNFNLNLPDFRTSLNIYNHIQVQPTLEDTWSTHRIPGNISNKPIRFLLQNNNSR